MTWWSWTCPSRTATATFDTYADVVCAAVEGRGDDVVLVGHSYAGNTIPLVAARRPLRHLVYLCAMIPDIGRSLADQLSDEPEMLNPVYEQGLSALDEQLRQGWTDLDAARDGVLRRLRRTDRRGGDSTGFDPSRYIRRSSRARWPKSRL